MAAMALRLLKCASGYRYSGGYRRGVFTVKVDEKLDIRNVAAPYCLLMVKSTLVSMKPGAVLEVQVRDPESTGDLMAILDRSGDKIVAKVQREDGTRLWVQKGPEVGSPCLINPETATNV